MRRRLVGPLLVAAACGSKTSAPLHPAGSAFDDGAGQLAAASGALFFDGADDSDGIGGQAAERRADRDYRDNMPNPDPYGGSIYGGSLYGGAMYGGTGYGAMGQPNPPARPLPRYASMAVNNGGAVSGTVRWPRPPRAPATLATACGDLTNPSLVLGTGGALGEAVVYLDRIERGRPVASAARLLQVGGQLERRGCALVPAVQVVSPVPSNLELVNGLAQPIALTIAGDDTVALKLGAGVSQRAPLNPGVVRISDNAGGVAPAWAVAVFHPYFAMTDADGRFRIDDIPPGSYDLVVWHAPVITGMKDGQAVLGAPVVVRRPVTVTADHATALAIDLPAAP
jgi:hypothetical protein